MKIEVTDGTGAIEIAISLEHASYFKYFAPLVAVWPDNYGSIGQFLTIFHRKNGVTELQEQLLFDVYADYSNRIDEVVKILKPIFKLLANGQYWVAFYTSEEKTLFSDLSSSDIQHFQFEITGETNVKSAPFTWLKHKNFLFKNMFDRKYAFSNILEYTTYNFFVWGNAFVATQPMESINQELVEQYCNEIKNGYRPFAIVLSKFLSVSKTNSDFSTSTEQYYSPYYVLDGHHKLLAYQRMKIHPPILSIMAAPESIDDLKFNIEELKNLMFSWQYDHLLKSESDLI